VATARASRATASRSAAFSARRAPTRILDEHALAELVRGGRGLTGEQLAAFLERGATGGEDPRDDIALLVIEVDQPAPQV
jgi:hypothetical protein